MRRREHSYQRLEKGYLHAVVSSPSPCRCSLVCLRFGVSACISNGVVFLALCSIPEQRMRRPLRVHIPNQLQVVGSLSVNHHSAFNWDIANAERPAREAGVELGFDVLEESAYSGERIVSASERKETSETVYERIYAEDVHLLETARTVPARSSPSTHSWRTNSRPVMVTSAVPQIGNARMAFTAVIVPILSSDALDLSLGEFFSNVFNKERC